MAGPSSRDIFLSGHWNEVHRLCVRRSSSGAASVSCTFFSTKCASAIIVPPFQSRYRITPRQEKCRLTLRRTHYFPRCNLSISSSFLPILPRTFHSSHKVIRLSKTFINLSLAGFHPGSADAYRAEAMENSLKRWQVSFKMVLIDTLNIILVCALTTGSVCRICCTATLTFSCSCRYRFLIIMMILNSGRLFFSKQS